MLSRNFMRVKSSWSLLFTSPHFKDVHPLPNVTTTHKHSNCIRSKPVKYISCSCDIISTLRMLPLASVRLGNFKSCDDSWIVLREFLMISHLSISCGNALSSLVGADNSLSLFVVGLEPAAEPAAKKQHPSLIFHKGLLYKCKFWTVANDFTSDQRTDSFLWSDAGRRRKNFWRFSYKWWCRIRKVNWWNCTNHQQSVPCDSWGRQK